VHAVLGPYTLSNVGDSESSSFAIIYSGGPRGASVAALLWGVREAMTRTRTTEVGPRLPLSTERIYPPIYSCLRISRLYGIGPWRVKTSSKANRERLRLTAQVEQLRWAARYVGMLSSLLSRTRTPTFRPRDARRGASGISEGRRRVDASLSRWSSAYCSNLKQCQNIHHLLF
jgi:hypothetical protein